LLNAILFELRKYVVDEDETQVPDDDDETQIPESQGDGDPPRSEEFQQVIAGLIASGDG